MDVIEKANANTLTESTGAVARSRGDLPERLERTGNAATDRLNALAIKGTFWTLGSYAGSQALRLAGNIVLTRLLVPQYFGLMTLLNTMVIGLGVMSDVGVNGSVIRDPRGDDLAFLNTAWTMQVIRGVVLWSICIVLARPAARFYREPGLVAMLPLLGLTLLLNGISSIKIYSLVRHLEVRKFALFELLMQIIQLVATAGWALIHPSVWALIGGLLIASVVRCITSHLLLPSHPHRFTWERQSAASIIKFGKWVLVAEAYSILSSQSDRLILGRLISLQTLALYGWHLPWRIFRANNSCFCRKSRVSVYCQVCTCVSS